MKLTEQTQTSLEIVLEYLAAEKQNYFCTPIAERTSHIYESMLRLRRWLQNPDGGPDYFWGCPKCADGQNDGFLNIGRGQWFVCHIHRLKWFAGSNLFRSWKDENESIWRENLDLIKDYEEIEPSIEND